MEFIITQDDLPTIEDLINVNIQYILLADKDRSVIYDGLIRYGLEEMIRKAKNIPKERLQWVIDDFPYQDVTFIEQLAFWWRAIILSQVFEDANHRTAQYSLERIIEKFNCELRATDNEIYDVIYEFNFLWSQNTWNVVRYWNDGLYCKREYLFVKDRLYNTLKDILEEKLIFL